MDIDKIKKRLLIKYPFFRSTIVKLEFVEDINCLGYNGQPTAGTDNDKVYYHPDFVSKLDEDEQLFLFAHEVGHVALDHIKRSEGRDQETWNKAADAVLNANLIKDGLKFIKGGVNIPWAIDYDVETLYNKLIQEKLTKNQNGNNMQQSNSSMSVEQSENNTNSGDNNLDENYDIGFDTHKMWSSAIEKEKSKSSGKDDESSDLDNKNKYSFLEKLFKNNNKDKKEQSEGKESEKEESDDISKMGEQQAFSKNRQEKKKLLEELRDSLAKQAMGAGNSTNESIRSIDNIGTSMPLIDWRRILKESVKFDIDWSYKNAFIEDGVVTPQLEAMPTPETEILLDTSGSIDDTLLRNFLRECKNILQSSRVKVGCFDTKFYGFHEIKTDKDIDNMKFIGHGGTNFDVAVEAFSRRVENKIIFTDGDANMPQQAVDAIWIVFGGKKINPKGGKVIYITDEQLSRLCSNLNYDDVESISRTR